jgi:hypothetical protein
MAARPGNNYRAQSTGKTALQRFAEKCVFDFSTGCVLWTGATTAGQGNTTRYGSFWAEGRRVFAHRWAAVHIHGIELGSDEAGHCCPNGPNSLCVQHLEGQTKADNIAERNRRVAKASQPSLTRQAWLFVQLGINGEPEPESAPEKLENDIPFHQPPDWLRPYMRPPEANDDDDDDCPF